MRIAILGGAAAAARCIYIAASTEGISISLALSDPERDRDGALIDAATRIGVASCSCKNINSKDMIQKLIATHTDILFSINNYQVISTSVLDALPRGAVNMHESLLPNYAGLNSCSWMILNGETRHGVTWHRVTDAIDGGPILAQGSFPVDSDMTALMATMEVIKTGAKLFGTVLQDLRDENAIERMQGTKASYYSAKKIPFDGRFPLEADFETLERLSRAINFHPMPGRFFEPILMSDFGVVSITSFDLKLKRHAAPIGLVFNSAPGTAEIAVRHGVAQLELTDQCLFLPKGSYLRVDN